MPDLNLTEAIEAAADAILNHGHGGFCNNGINVASSDGTAESAITAALPHILDALAEQANSERVFANVMPPVTEDAYIVVRWLRTKAVEVRSA